MDLKSSCGAHDERGTQWRDEALAVVAHELRDPLHTIAVGLETLLKLQPPGDERAARQLVVMQRTVRRMNRLIVDLLDVTRIEAGNLALAKENVQVPPLLNEVVELFEAPARQRGISLTCDAPPAVPCVIGERDRLLRVLSNLVSNAVKFTPPNGQISVRARLIEETLHFSVGDTGPGIPSESLP
jgi:signal transduction histidine kinase